MAAKKIIGFFKAFEKCLSKKWEKMKSSFADFCEGVSIFQGKALDFSFLFSEQIKARRGIRGLPNKMNFVSQNAYLAVNISVCNRAVTENKNRPEIP